MPAWVQAGYQEYARRLPPECALQLTEIPLGQRRKGGDPRRAVQEEGARMLKALPKGGRIIALEVGGCAWSTEALARALEGWLGEGSPVALLVGGPDGLSEECLARAGQRWSLSPLTLPHPLVRVVVAEQLYRAWSILRHLPYHRT